MYKLIGMRLHSFTGDVIQITVLSRATINTLLVLPRVLDLVKDNIPLHVIELRNRKRTVRILRAVNRTAGQKGSQLRDGNAVELVLENPVAAFLQVWNFVRKTSNKPLRNFAEEHSGFACRIGCLTTFDTITRLFP